MTRNSNNQKTKWRAILTLLLIALLSFTLLFSTACGKDDEEDAFKVPSYNYTEESDENTIKNSSFTYSIGNVAFDDLPKTSVSGWSRSSDNGMTATSAKSGVINVSEIAWDDVIDTLYSDSYFLDYFKVMYGVEIADIQDEIRNGDENKNPTTSEVKNYFIDNYICANKKFTYNKATVKTNTFGNPGKYDEKADDYVYMLTNFLAKNSVGLGTAQSLKSESTITLKKGGYGKVTVWVKTQNVGGSYGDKTNFGANVHLTNTLNSTNQADFGIFNIVAEEWTQYTIYVKGDETYESSFSINLGLGYDKYSATEGIAYFDQIEYTDLTAKEFASEIAEQQITFDENTNAKTIAYNSEVALKTFANKIKVGAVVSPVLYNMSIADSLTNSSYLNEYTFTDINSAYTISQKTDSTSNISGGRFDTDPENKSNANTITLDNKQFPYSAKAIKAHLVNSSYTITFGSENNKDGEGNTLNNLIKVESQKYAYVEFYVQNQLSKFSSTSITVDIYDVNGSVVKKQPAIATFSEVSEDWAKVSLVIKNNFESGDRYFFYSVIIGPTNVATTDYILDYASGDVVITYPKVAFGDINQYDDGGVETDNYDIYSLFSSTATGSTSLYAGNSADYVEATDTETYNFTVAHSDIGVIETRPAVPVGYQGIVANHFYIKEDVENVERDINTKITVDKTAGLINTKYLTNYTKLGDLVTALNFDSADEHYQPLVIYNETPDNYGFVGESNTISALAYAKVSVTLRVTNGATAYVYLVDTGDVGKNVMTFSDFTANVNSKGEDISNGTQYNGQDDKFNFYFAVNENTMKGEDWITVEFYVGTGDHERDFRVEVWNGSRDGNIASSGYVFVSEILVKSNAGFSEPTSWNSAFTTSGNPLYEVGKSEFSQENLILYKQQLTEIERQYNEEYDDDVSYSPTYIWAKNDTFLYAIFNTIDPDVVNPYDNLPEEEEEETGCRAESDPASFWLSFSSILLAAVLFLAILALITKNVRRRHKANKSDAKSHYKITSRTKGKTTEKKSWFARFKANDSDDEDEEVIKQVETEEQVEEAEETPAEETEQNLDEYVYGDVQDFGETDESNSSESKDNE